MFSCKATQRSTQALGAAQGACAAERFTGAHPPSRAGPLSDYKVAVDASVRRRSGRMCRRKVRWRSSSPLRGSPPRTRPRTAMPFGGTCAPSSLLHRDLRMPLYPLALILADSRALCLTGICAALYYACIFLRKSLMVFCMRQVMVIGPTPPGTGVMTDAIGSTAS